MASLTLGGVGGRRAGLRRPRRQARAHAGAVAQHPALFGLHLRVRAVAQNVWQLAIFRVLLGLGMGGEWASGATLVSETWPEKHRGKALGIMQSCWAIGYGLAAIVVAIVLPRFGWRAVFFVGILPALFTLWIRRSVKEPEMWLDRRRRGRGTRPSAEARVGRRLPAATLASLSDRR